MGGALINSKSISLPLPQTIDILLLIHTDDAVQLDWHDTVNTTRIDMQVQGEDNTVTWHGYDLHVGYCSLVQTKLRGEECAQGGLIQCKFYHAWSRDWCSCRCLR